MSALDVEPRWIQLQCMASVQDEQRPIHETVKSIVLLLKLFSLLVSVQNLSHQAFLVKMVVKQMSLHMPTAPSIYHWYEISSALTPLYIILCVYRQGVCKSVSQQQVQNEPKS